MNTKLPLSFRLRRVRERLSIIARDITLTSPLVSSGLLNVSAQPVRVLAQAALLVVVGHRSELGLVPLTPTSMIV
jgi:hypothetical protein